MNSSIQKDLLALRKRDLQRKIFDANKLENKQNYLFLKSQWVHRYGLDTLPDDQELQNLFEYEFSNVKESDYNSNSKEKVSSDIEDESPLEIEEKCEINFEDGMEEDDSFPEIETKQHEETLINSSNQELEEKLNQQENPYSNCETNEFLLEEDVIDNNNEENYKTNFSLEEDLKISDNIKPQENNEVKKEVDEMPSPPPPSLNNLRRWIT